MKIFNPYFFFCFSFSLSLPLSLSFFFDITCNVLYRATTSLYVKINTNKKKEERRKIIYIVSFECKVMNKRVFILTDFFSFFFFSFIFLYDTIHVTEGGRVILSREE